ncbi:MAG: tRNA pseudouridine(55) synthase TruB [Candidatus Magasanikbacteria bacterium]|nr:tRNA pseudouridine(55) synthase TruB [Candidatus Magasanikbacteria bacterium]
MTPLPPDFLLINKPAGWTSFDVVNFIRKKARVDSGNKKIRVGHAGTLDPFATGLLIVGVGREATKKLDEFKNLPKTYLATIKLGATSDTGDVTGVITETPPSPSPLLRGGESPSSIAMEGVGGGFAFGKEGLGEVSEKQIKKILKQFLGKQRQIPPMYSAKKIGGQRLYKLARAGKTIKREPSEIEIYKIKLLSYDWPILKIEVTCGAGTYIRTLAEDIGKKLGTMAYCQELTRTKIGPYALEQTTDFRSKSPAA